MLVDAGDDVVVDWVVDRLALGTATRMALKAALAQCQTECPGPTATWMPEFHHDGSGRVDLSVFVPRPSGRRVTIEGLGFVAGELDFWEYDLDGQVPRLAGIFHAVASCQDEEWPTAATALGTPSMIAHLVGRRGEVRLLASMPGQAEWERAMDARGCVDLPMTPLKEARELTAAGIPVRIGVDYLAGQGRLGTRLGIEVFAEPGVSPVLLPVLADLGVAAADVDRMLAMLVRLPVGRERSRRIPGLPGPDLGRAVDAVRFSHIGVSWTDDGVRLKSYLTVTSSLPAG